MEYKQWLDNRLLQNSIENKRTFFLYFILVHFVVCPIPLENYYEVEHPKWVGLYHP